MIAKGKSISHGTAALEYDLAKEINGEAAATEIHRHELFGCTGEEMVQEMKPYFVDFPNVKNNCLRFEVSPSVEESAGMTDADWAKLGNDFMQRMGLSHIPPATCPPLPQRNESIHASRNSCSTPINTTRDIHPANRQNRPPVNNHPSMD